MHVLYSGEIPGLTTRIARSGQPTREATDATPTKRVDNPLSLSALMVEMAIDHDVADVR